MTITPPPIDAISLAAASRLVPIDGKPPSPVTLWRYARRGKFGIKLKSWKRGRQIVTTAEAVREFERAVAEADAHRWASRCGDTTPTQSSRDVEARAKSLGV
jgi:hypothetical protein